jgi:nitrate reductase (cytochrome), electron transfer subunit
MESLMKILDLLPKLITAMIVSLLVLTVVTFADDKKKKEISDEELGIRKTTLMNEDVMVPESSMELPEPGDSERIARAFENCPPIIPHSVTDFLPITIDENMCAECHLPDVAEDYEATPVPASHMFDLRSGEQTGAMLNGANYICVSCHAPLTDAALIIENTFEKVLRSEESNTSSNLLDILNEGVE